MRAISSDCRRFRARRGSSWGEALAMITSRPAEAIGMGGEIGSLAPGRRADVVIWSGDPLEGTSAAEQVFIDGVRQPLETHQTRLVTVIGTCRDAIFPRHIDIDAPGGPFPVASIAFVGTHFLLSHALRRRWCGGGRGAFRGIYSLVALMTFGLMIYFYRVIGREPPLWDGGHGVWCSRPC